MNAKGRRAADEEILVSARAHVRHLFPVLVVAMALAAAAGFAAAALEPPWRGVIVLAATAGWVIASAPRVTRWWSTRHVVTSRRVVLRTGVVRRRQHDVRVRNVHDVYVERSMVQRFLGCGDVVTETVDDEPLVLRDVVDPDELVSRIVVASELAGMTHTGVNEPGSAARDPLETLRTLADLRERGHLDDDEFANYKRRLVDGETDDRPTR